MIRKSLALFVVTAFLAGPAFATTATSGGGGGGGGGHSGSGSGGHSGGGASGHGGGGHGAFGGHAHGAAAHAVSARAASAGAHSGHHHHHASGATVWNSSDRRSEVYSHGGYPMTCSALTDRADRILSCGGPSKMHIDPTTGAPAP